MTRSWRLWHHRNAQRNLYENDQAVKLISLSCSKRAKPTLIVDIIKIFVGIIIVILCSLLIHIIEKSTGQQSWRL